MGVGGLIFIMLTAFSFALYKINENLWFVSFRIIIAHIH